MDVPSPRCAIWHHLCTCTWQRLDAHSKGWMRTSKVGCTQQRLDAHSKGWRHTAKVGRIQRTVGCTWQRLDTHSCTRSSKDSKLHLASSPKQQTGNSLLDVVMAIDAGRHQLKDLLVQLWLRSKFLEPSLFFRPACKAASHTPPLLHLHSADCGKNKGSHDECICHWETRAVRVCIDDVESGLEMNVHKQHARYVQGNFVFFCIGW